MKATFSRLRAPSLPGNSQSRHLTTAPPPLSSTEYSFALAELATRILYRSPLPSRADLPIYILDAAAFPDSKEVSYDALLPYVLARLPGEEELIGGAGYEIVFFAGGTGLENSRRRKGSSVGNESRPAAEGSSSNATGNAPVGKTKKSRPGWGWFLQAYHVLSRAMRKRLMKLYVVHEKGWIRVVMEMFATIVSPKMRKKVVHVSSLSALAFHIPIEDLLIPPSAYVVDRQKTRDIFAPYASGRRAFGVKTPLPTGSDNSDRLPRVLREATIFVLTNPLVKTDGLFRVSARAQTVEVLKEAYDRGQKFIVWREGDTVLTFPHFKEGKGTVVIDELDPIEGYDVHVAAAIIKMWYHDLRQPILPFSNYQALEKLYGGTDPPSQDGLFQLLSPDENDFSPFPIISRKILVLHLLPTLSRVAAQSDFNRMTPANLATVFAPNLVCGPDQIADIKMIAILQRLLTALISSWKTTLAPLFGSADETFVNLLRLPERVADREDPLEEQRPNTNGTPTEGITHQVSGISLVENDRESDGSMEEEDRDLFDEEGHPPALPPRPSRTTSSTTEEDFNSSPTNGSGQPVRRKPAPAMVALPRYSTIINDRSAALAGLDSYQINTVGVGHDPPHIAETGRNDDHDGNADDDADAEEVLPSYEQSSSGNNNNTRLERVGESPDTSPAAGASSAAGIPIHHDGDSIQRKPVAVGSGSGTGMGKDEKT